MHASESTTQDFRVVLAGGGVAALEAALALRALAAERVSIALLAPDRDFVYRPLRVREPFALPGARSYALDRIARDIGIELVSDAFAWLDAPAGVVHTAGDRALDYDAFLLAVGARLYPAFTHSVTIDDRILDEQLHGLIQDVEDGYVASIAFLAPSAMAWPLPLYELALMTARRAFDMNTEVAITVATPEDAPLAVFGDTVSQAVAKLLEDNGIALITRAHSSVPAPGRVVVAGSPRPLEVDRIVALPQLVGPAAAGVPGDARSGFIPIDEYCRVRGLANVFAAGDATDSPVKLGGLAAQHADTAALAIAAMAGAAVEPAPLDAHLQAILLGADRPLYLSARLSGSHGTDSQVSEEPLWSPPSKIAARYLAPYLESLDPEPQPR